MLQLARVVGPCWAVERVERAAATVQRNDVRGRRKVDPLRSSNFSDTSSAKRNTRVHCADLRTFYQTSQQTDSVT